MSFHTLQSYDTITALQIYCKFTKIAHHQEPPYRPQKKPPHSVLSMHKKGCIEPALVTLDSEKSILL